jgi:hypothetical protein
MNKQQFLENAASSRNYHELYKVIQDSSPDDVISYLNLSILPQLANRVEVLTVVCSAARNLKHLIKEQNLDEVFLDQAQHDKQVLRVLSHFGFFNSESFERLVRVASQLEASELKNSLISERLSAILEGRRSSKSRLTYAETYALTVSEFKDTESQKKLIAENIEILELREVDSTATPEARKVMFLNLITENPKIANWMYTNFRQKMNINGQDFWGRNALHLTAAVDAPELFLRIIMDEVTERYQNFWLQSRDKSKERQTPLAIACQSKNYAELTKPLIEAGSDVNVLIGPYGDARTILQRLYDRGGELAIRRIGDLVALGLPIEGVNADGTTLLMYIAKKKDLESMREIIKKGASLLTKDKNGKTATDYVLETNDIDFINAFQKEFSGGWKKAFRKLRRR